MDQRLSRSSLPFDDFASGRRGIAFAFAVPSGADFDTGVPVEDGVTKVRSVALLDFTLAVADGKVAFPVPPERAVLLPIPALCGSDFGFACCSKLALGITAFGSGCFTSNRFGWKPVLGLSKADFAWPISELGA